MAQRRKQTEDLIYKIVSLQDPSGYNTKKYQELFSSYNDDQFDVYMKTLRDNPHAKLVLFVPPFKVVIKPEYSFAAAKALGLEFLERIKLWDPIGKRYCLTPERYFILKLPVRRLKQYLMDGLSVPESDKRLNPLTDQVTGPSKGSAISFPQAQMISEKGLTTTLQEFMSARGGDLEAYAKLKSEIEETGETDMSVLEGTSGVRAVSTMRTFLNAMHLSTNL